MATNTETQVQQLYVGLLGRAADKAGLTYWANQITTGARTLDDVRAAFVTTTEYTTGFGALTARADLVTAIYTNLFERTPTTAEVAYWVADTRPANQLVSAFLTYASAADQAVITNKTFVAQTYTDTAGTSFNAAAAKSVIDPVDGTAASVATAISAISNGTVGGLTPGAALIGKVAAVQAEVTALEKATAGTNATFDTNKDGSVTSVEATAAAGVAAAARTAVDAKTTAVLTTEASTAATNLLNAKALVAASGTAAVTAQSTYDAAVAAQKVQVGTTVGTAAVIGTGTAAAPQFPAKTAAEVAQANAVTGAATALTAVDSSLTAAGAATTYAKLNIAFGGTVAAPVITDSASLKIALNSVNGTTTKAALITELQKLPVFGQAAIDSVAKEASIIAANTAVTNAEGAAGFGATGYVAAAKANATAADVLAKATAADAAVAAAKVVTDKFAALDTKTTLANTELNTFKAANVDKVLITDLTANGNAAVVTATAAKSDVFYFTKVTTGLDFNVGGTAATTFGTGDSIVLGSAYTANAGALTAGNNTALEVFFVKGATGTQVVIETNAVGSATTVVDAAGNVTASPDAAVINLVGVTAEHVSFANGVVSYV